MNSNSIKQQLGEKLKELFQFENKDLNFGIYRILNFKRKEIEKFIKEDLINAIKMDLELLSDDERKEIENRLKEKSSKNGVKKYLQALQKGDEEGAKTLKEYFEDSIKEYDELKGQFEQIQVSEDLEKQVYNHLINFFSRYYDNGDFISKRRYSRKEKYVAPYNGEEVLFHWSNNGQYYIKTTEYFTKYTFKVTDYLTVNFRVVDAEEEKGNAKSEEKKFFVLSDKVFEFNKEKKVLDIYFEYRSLTEEEKEKYKYGNSISQDKANQETIEILKEKIPQNSLARFIFEKEGEKTLIEKHLLRYTRRNTTDFFIHKDLKSFLEREMDFYIKNEFLDLDDLQVLERSGYFDKLRLYLIAVRAFRKIALKIIDFLAQIENFQKKLWEKKKFVIDTHYVITLDKIKEFAGEQFLESILNDILNNKKQLTEWKELFGIEVKDKNDLIESNEQIEFDGKKWKKLPIDTKYFSEDFKWKLLAALSNENDLDDILDGVLIKSENFQALNLLLNKYKEKVQTIYIDPPFNTGKDFLYKDNYQNSSWLTLMGNRLRLAKDLLKNSGSLLMHLDGNANYYGRFLLNKIFGENNFRNEIVWGYRTGGAPSKNNPLAKKHDYLLYFSKSEELFFIKLKERIIYEKPFFTTSKDEKGNYYALVNLRDIWEDENVVFDEKDNIIEINLKPVINVSEERIENFLTQKPEGLIKLILLLTTNEQNLILDFFLGSGTTIATAHKLKRKWLGVEMGEHFYTVILPRMKKVLFYDKSGISKEKDIKEKYDKDKAGGFFKYHTLEQYEDALENIEFDTGLGEKASKMFPDYIFYMLDWETKNSSTFLNLEKLQNPFEYKLKIIENYEQRTVNVDVIETFNYLLGLKVGKYKIADYNGKKYVFVFGEKNGKKITIVWRSMKNIDLEQDKKFIEGQIKDFNPDEIYINGDALVTNFKSIEYLFKSLMFERIEV